MKKSSNKNSSERGSAKNGKSKGKSGIDNTLKGKAPIGTDGSTPKQKDPKRKFPKFNILWIYILVALLFLVPALNPFDSSKPIEIDWITDVKEKIAPSGDIDKIIFIENLNKGEIFIHADSLTKYSDRFGGKDPTGIVGPHFSFSVSKQFNPEEQIEEVRALLEPEKRFRYKTESRINYFGKALEWLAFPIILVLLWLFMFRRINRSMGGRSGGGTGGGGIFSVGKSQAKLFDRETSHTTTFEDVAGLEEAKVEVMEIVDFLKNPSRYTALGGKIPKGALLVGPPGTGKTLLAKAVAGEAHVPFFSISGSDFVEMFVGVGASRVRDLFKQAKEKAPCIVFIDEIDAVGRARSKNVGFSSNDERENTLNQLLTEMDGFGSNSGVIILAATNRADILDKALLRAGRFDRQIHVDLPELKEREAIFNVHLKPLKLDPDFDVKFLSKQTPGFSGADIANVCNEAALIAARKNKEFVTRQDFLDAVDRIVAGLEKRSKIISPEEKRTIAFHEAGHATVSWVLPHANPLLKVTIIPRGRSLGAAWYLPEERQLTTSEQMLDDMTATLGGRAAEEIINGVVSSGALSDLEKVTKQAYAMVSYLGMSDAVGNLSFYDSSDSAGYTLGKPYSEKTAELIDAEAKRIIDSCYVRAKELLEEHREGFTLLAEQLLEKEVIFAEDLEKIFGKKAGKQPPVFDFNVEDEEEVEETQESSTEEKEESEE